MIRAALETQETNRSTDGTFKVRYPLNPTTRGVPSPDMTDAIRFFRPDAPYGFLSNFACSAFFLDDATWPTVEHYFQAAKYDEAAAREWVRSASTPTEAKRLGRMFPARADWNHVRVHVMRAALAAKFEQNPVLADSLRATGGTLLIEGSPRDSFWGEGSNGRGRNLLGRLLMELRESLNVPTFHCGDA